MTSTPDNMAPAVEAHARAILTSLLASSNLNVYLNNCLRGIHNRPHEAPRGSFDEVLLCSLDCADVYLVRTNGQALYRELYVSGSYRSQLLYNISDVTVELRLYGEPIDTAKSKGAKLADLGCRRLEPRASLWIGRGETTFEARGPDDETLLSLRMNDRSRRAWMYRASTLEAVYEVSHEPSGTQTVFILNTLTRLRQRCDSETVTACLESCDEAVRLAAVKYALVVTPERGLDALRGLARGDGQLAQTAASLLRAIAEQREQGTAHSN
jgi:hypothetical protein